MSQVHIFKNRISSCNYVFEDGSVANFVGGVYTTDDDTKALELQNLVDGIQKRRDNKGNEVFDRDGNNMWVKTAKHPHIYQDEGVKTIDSEQLDPLWAIKQQIRDQILAEMAAADPNRDMGTSESGKLNVTSSANVVGEKTGSATAVSLNAMMAKLNQQMTPVLRTGDPEPNPNAVPNAAAAPGNAVIPENAAVVAGVNPAEALAAMMQANLATKNSIVPLGDASL